MAGAETVYLQQLVGDALSRGCAATVVAQPNDPVAYLGEWLLRYVKNAEVEGTFYQQKQAALKAQVREKEADENAKRRAEDAEAEKKASLEKLAAMVADPETLWQHAVDLLTKHTKASAAYLANIVDPEEPDWTPPEGDEAAEAETDDEVEESKDAAPAGDAAAVPAEDTSEPPAAVEEPAAEAAAEDLQEAAVDYSKKLLTYCISSPGHEFMKELELRRPAPLTDEQAEAGAQPETTAVTFRVLDEKLPVLSIDNVAFEKDVKFFRKFPRVGAYQACAVALASGEYRHVLCAETLLPEGSGRPFTKEEQDFVWQVALALGRAVDAAHTRLQEHSQMAVGGDEVVKMRQKIREVYFPPPPPPAEGEEGEPGAEGEAAAPLGSTPAVAPPVAAADETAAALPAEGKAAAAAEVAEPTPEELEIKRIQEEMAGQTAKLQALQSAASSALQHQETEQRVLVVIKESIMSVEILALRNFRMYSTTPKATFHVLKAVLLLLGKQLVEIADWKHCRRHISSELFQAINSYDATPERDMAVWKQIRECYKAVTGTKGLEKEMPSTHFGIMLLRFIKQVRRVAKATSALRAADAAVVTKQQELAANGAELEAAQKAKDEAEAAKAEAERAAAAGAADEAAAAAAAAAGEAEAPEGAAEEQPADE